jgi:hypothetical protein
MSLNQKGLDRLLHVRVRDPGAGTNLHEGEVSDTRLVWTTRRTCQVSKAKGEGKCKIER